MSTASVLFSKNTTNPTILKAFNTIYGAKSDLLRPPHRAEHAKAVLLAVRLERKKPVGVRTLLDVYLFMMTHKSKNIKSKTCLMDINTKGLVGSYLYHLESK